MLHELGQFFSSLAWWEWVIGIPAFLFVGAIIFCLTMAFIVNLTFAALTNQRVGNYVFFSFLLLASCAVVGILARHL